MFNDHYNCPHCFSDKDTWFDRSCLHDEYGNELEYECFADRCSDCGRNVNAPRSYYNLPDIRYVPHDVYLPATKVDPDTGEPLDCKFVETLMIPVYNNYDMDFVTPTGHLMIQRSKLIAFFKRLDDYETFMSTQHEELDGLTVHQALATDDGQRACICLLSKLGVL